VDPAKEAVGVVVVEVMEEDLTAEAVAVEAAEAVEVVAVEAVEEVAVNQQ
jgi:hypothetical protein